MEPLYPSVFRESLVKGRVMMVFVILWSVIITTVSTVFPHFVIDLGKNKNIKQILCNII